MPTFQNAKIPKLKNLKFKKFEISNFPKCQHSKVVIGLLYPTILHEYPRKVVESRDTNNRALLLL